MNKEGKTQEGGYVVPAKENTDEFISYLDGNSLTKAQLYTILENTPYCLNVWNKHAQNVFCNQYAASLFGYNGKDDYLQNLHNLAPETQPDGGNSQQLAIEYIIKAYETGLVRFNWMLRKKDGEEIPAEIILKKLVVNGEEDSELLLGITRDLREQLTGFDGVGLEDGFFFNRITHRVLFETIAELSEEWFWVYDIAAATIQFFGEGRKILELSGEKQPFPEYVVGSGMVYPSDLDVFMAFSEAVKVGFDKPYDVRFMLPSGVPNYFRIIYKTIFSKEGTPLFSIGKTFDINDQKTLEVLSRTDLLTNCLNKIATENAIKEAISMAKSSMHALFIIDVDNFKAVNDNLGHHFGDLVLAEIAANLHTNFREGDIIGRIGGDEFIVFIQNVTNKQIIETKAEIIAKAFHNTYSGEKRDYKISGSIGIALYPADGSDYESLYKSADKALYQSKMRGKDCYTFYTNDLVDGTMKNLTIVENANRLANSYFDADLVSAVFNLMYESQDVGGSLNTVLQYIGKKLNVDRCYLFETYDEGATYSISYEWCSAKATAEMENLQNISKELLGDFFDVLDENGVIYSNDETMIESEDAYRLIRGQNIKSFLLVQSKGKAFTRIVLGLDDCSTSRVWSEKEINSMRHALRMISIFMMSNIERKRQIEASLNTSLIDSLSKQEQQLLEKLKEKGIGFYKK